MKKRKKKGALLLLSLLMMLQWMCGIPNPVYAFYDSDLPAIGQMQKMFRNGMAFVM